MSEVKKIGFRLIIASCGSALFILFYSFFDKFSHPKYFYPFWKFYHGNSSLGELFSLLDLEALLDVLSTTLFNLLLITILILAAIILRKPLGRFQQSFISLDRRLFLAVIFTFSLINLVRLFKYNYQAFPQGGDDAAYLFQASLLTEGRLWAPAHPLKEFFKTDYIINNNGKTYSEYTLGTPIFLALGIMAGLPWLVNPLLGSLSLIFLYLIAVRLFDESIARYGAVLVSISIYFTGICATYTSHPVTLVCLTVFLFFFIKTIDHESRLYPVISGLFFGIALNSRQLTAVSFAFPFWIWGIVRLIGEGKKKLPRIILFLAGSFLPILGMLVVNNIQNNGPLVFGHTIYNGPKKTYGFTGEYYPFYAVGTFFFRWRHIIWQLVSLLISPAVILILFLFSCFGKVQNRLLPWAALLFVSLAYLPVISNLWHIRYYFVPAMLLIFLVPFGLRRLGEWFKSYFQELKPDSFILVFVTVCLVYYLKGFSFAPESMVVQYMRPYRVVEEAGIKNAVVFLKSTTYFNPTWYCRNSPDYDGDILYAIDLGERNHQLIEYYPERAFFRYDLGNLIPIGQEKKSYSDNHLSATGEAPYPLWERE